jgi:hypothetical protein
MRVIKASILGLLNVGSMEELRRTLISKFLQSKEEEIKSDT